MHSQTFLDTLDIIRVHFELSRFTKKAETQQISEEEVINTMKKSIPANRFGEAAETANAVAFLCSPAAAYINGINLPVDGGRTASL